MKAYIDTTLFTPLNGFDKYFPNKGAVNIVFRDDKTHGQLRISAVEITNQSIEHKRLDLINIKILEKKELVFDGSATDLIQILKNFLTVEKKTSS